MSLIMKKFDNVYLEQMCYYPKCFIVQACRGEEPGQITASPWGKQEESKAVRPTSVLAQPDIPTANGNDMLLFFPCAEGEISHLGKCGSLFIQNIIQTLRENYKSDHLVDIFVEVMRKTSEQLYKVATDKYNMAEASQMPHLQTTFTKKLYLKLPNGTGQSQGPSWSETEHHQGPSSNLSQPVTADE